MAKKLLVVCGPTAVGKTSLAINLAKKFGGEIVSADSRQVYKNMDIGTGKGLPRGAKFQRPFLSSIGGYYLIEGVKVWGYDLVNPKKNFDVSKYSKIAKKVISETWKRGNLPILTGGTGLYIKVVCEGISTEGIPKNKKIRKSLRSKKVGELYDRLATLDPIKAANMNASDRKNPRRLIRAIEIAMWKVGRRKEVVKENRFGKDMDLLKIGLTLPSSSLETRIKKRVDERVSQGFEEELKKLIKKKVSLKSQAFDSIGYRKWASYLKGDISKKEALLGWISEERQYAKRQMTWFKKDRSIKWFNPNSKKYPKDVEKMVQAWYKGKNDKKN